MSKSPPEKRRFVLEAERGEEAEANGKGVLRVERFRVSRLFERKGFVYRTGGDRFENDFYNEFFAPPGALLREAVGHWLEDSPLFSNVIGGTDSTRADWLLEARVNELYGDLRDAKAPQAVMEIHFTLLDARSPTLTAVFTKRYSARVDAADTSPEAVLAAWNASLIGILTELEADLAEHLQT
jgi:cholesterol transport system auxiliary component